MNCAHTLALAEAVRAGAPEAEIHERLQRIHRGILANSAHVKIPDFSVIHPSDLKSLFEAYDGTFFSGLCSRALNGRKLDFRLSSRMTHAGGKTTRVILRETGVVFFEISIASSMLFDAFGETDRDVTVCGIACRNRLEALQRIFEHELVHLIEQLCWGESNCSAERFQGIAGRCFLHRSHRHALITRRERAVNAGIRVGARVGFTFDGARLTGRVNRITKRVTVLVEDMDGVRYSDGRRYKIYYVPIAALESVPAAD